MRDILEPTNPTIWLEPRISKLTVEELRTGPEHELAENAVEFFIHCPDWVEKDRQAVERLFEKYGWGMFIWKYYIIGRYYLGGYRALSACLKLRALR